MLDTDVFQYVKARDNAEAWHWCVFQYEDWLMCTSKQYVYLCETSRGLPPHQYVQPIWIDHVYRDGLCLLWRDSVKVWQYVILRYIVHNSVWYAKAKYVAILRGAPYVMYDINLRVPREREAWLCDWTCACITYATDEVRSSQMTLWMYQSANDFYCA